MTCKDCCYFWKEDEKRFSSCHFEIRCPGDKAPCEYEDSDYVEDPDYPDEF